MTLKELQKCSEDQLLRQVLEMARYFGWRAAHFRPARFADGSWRTAVQGDGKGFPDLVLIRPPRVIFAELKSDTGRAAWAQTVWLDMLKRCPEIEVYTWRPKNWDEIVKTLSR